MYPVGRRSQHLQRALTRAVSHAEKGALTPLYGSVSACFPYTQDTAHPIQYVLYSNEQSLTLSTVQRPTHRLSSPLTIHQLAAPLSDLQTHCRIRTNIFSSQPKLVFRSLPKLYTVLVANHAIAKQWPTQVQITSLFLCAIGSCSTILLYPIQRVPPFAQSVAELRSALAPHPVFSTAAALRCSVMLRTYFCVFLSWRCKRPS